MILYLRKKQHHDLIHVVHTGKASIPANHMIYVIQMQTLRHTQLDLRAHFAGSVLIFSLAGGVFKSRWWKPLLGTPAVRADDLCGRNVGSPEVGGVRRAGRGGAGRGPRGTQQGGSRKAGSPWPLMGLPPQSAAPALATSTPSDPPPVWQFHSCGVTVGAGGLASLSTQILLFNCMSHSAPR